MYQLGSASIIMDRNTVYAAPKGGEGKWKLVSMDEATGTFCSALALALTCARERACLRAHSMCSCCQNFCVAIAVAITVCICACACACGYGYGWSTAAPVPLGVPWRGCPPRRVAVVWWRACAWHLAFELAQFCVYDPATKYVVWNDMTLYDITGAA